MANEKLDHWAKGVAIVANLATVVTAIVAVTLGAYSIGLAKESLLLERQSQSRPHLGFVLGSEYVEVKLGKYDIFGVPVLGTIKNYGTGSALKVNVHFVLESFDPPQLSQSNNQPNRKISCSVHPQNLVPNDVITVKAPEPWEWWEWGDKNCSQVAGKILIEYENVSGKKFLEKEQFVMRYEAGGNVIQLRMGL